eukprot:gene5451-5454_t
MACSNAQIPNMMRCSFGPNPGDGHPCTNQSITMWGVQLITAPIRAWLASPLASAAGSAAFVDSCSHHCGTWDTFDLVESVSPVMTGATAFASWRQHPATHLWSQPSDFP